MTELIIPNETVRNLTEAPRRLPIEIEGSVTYDLFLTVWSIFNPKESNTAHDLGDGWHDKVREGMSDELIAEFESISGPWALAMLALSSFSLSAPHPHDPDHVFDWLESVDDKRLRRWIIGYSSHPDADPGLIEQAAGGDQDALTQIAGEKSKKYPEVMEFLTWLISADGVSKRYAEALRQFRSGAFSEYEEQFSGPIARAAAARRAAPVRGDAKAVVEEVTSGLAFDIPLGIRRVVLVPSMVCRPLSLVDANRGTLVVYYGIADEFVNTDPDAPPSWLLRTYKALSDERRLRIMRRLSEGETSLEDLTEMLGLSKSTVHHHISQLRAAGLVRVHVPSHEDKSKHRIYSLREQSLADANGFLDSYLRTTDQEQQHA